LSEVLVLRVQAQPNTKPLGPSPDSRGTKAILAKLDEPIVMDFPGETPLEEDSPNEESRQEMARRDE
jgi:hypothetical protein